MPTFMDVFLLFILIPVVVAVLFFLALFGMALFTYFDNRFSSWFNTLSHKKQIVVKALMFYVVFLYVYVYVISGCDRAGATPLLRPAQRLKAPEIAERFRRESGADGKTSSPYI